MDRVERKRQLSILLRNLQLTQMPCGRDYEAVLGELEIETNGDRDILKAALVDNIYDCRRRGEDANPYLQFLTWLGGYLPD